MYTSCLIYKIWSTMDGPTSATNAQQTHNKHNFGLQCKICICCIVVLSTSSGANKLPRSDGKMWLTTAHIYRYIRLIMCVADRRLMSNLTLSSNMICPAVQHSSSTSTARHSYTLYHNSCTQINWQCKLLQTQNHSADLCFYLTLYTVNTLCQCSLQTVTNI